MKNEFSSFLPLLKLNSLFFRNLFSWLVFSFCLNTTRFSLPALLSLLHHEEVFVQRLQNPVCYQFWKEQCKTHVSMLFTLAWNSCLKLKKLIPTSSKRDPILQPPVKTTIIISFALLYAQFTGNDSAKSKRGCSILCGSLFNQIPL